MENSLEHILDQVATFGSTSFDFLGKAYVLTYDLSKGRLVLIDNGNSPVRTAEELLQDTLSSHVSDPSNPEDQ